MNLFSEKFKIIDLQQNTPEWLTFRKNHIGAADSPIIMGVCKYKDNENIVKTPHRLWQEKLGLLTCNTDNEATRYGRNFEEVARQLYINMTGIFIEPKVIEHSKITYLSASLDGLTMDHDLAVEIKCTNFDNHELAKKGQVPLEFYPQLQHQLLCTGHDKIHYFSYFKDEGVIVEVKRDEKFIEIMLKHHKEFWDCVQNFTEPELTDDDYREQDEEWLKRASRLWEIEESIRRDTLVAKRLKDELKALSEGLNSKAGDYRLCFSSRKGNIDYSVIPELENVNLEKYRKVSSTSCSLKKI